MDLLTFYGGPSDAQWNVHRKMAENVAAALENTRERKFRLIKLLQGCVLLPVVKLLENY